MVLSSISILGQSEFCVKNINSDEYIWIKKLEKSISKDFKDKKSINISIEN